MGREYAWRDTEITVTLPAHDVGVILEGLALARVHAADCLGGADSPRGAHAYDAKLLRCMELLAVPLGQRIAEQPAHAKWRELLTDTIRAYALAMWRGWNED